MEKIATIPTTKTLAGLSPDDYARHVAEHLARLHRADDAGSWAKASYYVNALPDLKARFKGKIKLANKAIRAAAEAGGLDLPPPTFLSHSLRVAETFPDIFGAGTNNRKLPYDHYKRIAVNGARDKAAVRAWAEQTKPTRQALDARLALEKSRQARTKYSPIIKPTDNWNFTEPFFSGIHDGVEEGTIPGDLYANILWYHSRPDDVVYCPMAGSGQIIRVWNERSEWMWTEEWEIKLITSDLNPRGPYRDRIIPCDIAKGAATDYADLIVMDPPYFHIVRGQYSDSERDIANAETVEHWRALMVDVAAVCRSIQSTGGRVVTVCPDHVDWDRKEQVLTSAIVREVFAAAGYTLTGRATFVRRIQQKQCLEQARRNNLARANRVPLSDTSEVAVFTARAGR